MDIAIVRKDVYMIHVADFSLVVIPRVVIHKASNPQS